MTFKDLVGDMEEWFWKLEFNPETCSYELYLGIPSDWVYVKNTEGPVNIEVENDLGENVVLKIYATDDEITVDDIIMIGKAMISKNRELELKKESHRLEMERLKNELIAKEKDFLYYIDTVKDVVPAPIKKVAVEEELVEDEVVNDGETEGTSEGEETIETPNTQALDFLNDIKKH